MASDSLTVLPQDGMTVAYPKAFRGRFSVTRIDEHTINLAESPGADLLKRRELGWQSNWLTVMNLAKNCSPASASWHERFVAPWAREAAMPSSTRAGAARM